jgi:polysaccharide biosynthesis protein VpsM
MDEILLLSSSFRQRWFGKHLNQTQSGLLKAGAGYLSAFRYVVSFIGLAGAHAFEVNGRGRSCVQTRVIRLGGLSRKRPALAPRTRLALACVGVLTSEMAHAQPAEVSAQTPIDLFLPETSAGVRIAPALVLKPGLDLTVEHDTNIYNRETNPRSDTIVIVRPTAHLGTDWSRHSLEIDGFVDVRRYFRTSSENSEQWGLKGQSTFDLGQRVTFNAGAGISRNIEARGSLGDSFNSDRPVSFTEKNANVQLSRTGGRLELIVGGSIVKYTFKDTTLGGLPIDLGYRDVVTRQAHVRSNFVVSPRMSFFVDLGGNQIDYMQSIGTPRNSSGYSTLLGGHYQVSALFDVEGAIGLIGQNYEDPAISRTSGINYAVTASWTPSPRWKLTAGGHRSVIPSPLPNVPAIIRSDFDLKAQYAVSSKVLLEFGGAYASEQYRGALRTDDHFLVNAAVFYRLSGNLLVSVNGGYRKQNSPVFGKAYDGFNIGMTLGTKL